MDPWDSFEPVEVLSKLPENFYEQLESTKWLERKETLEVLLKLLVDAPRLEPSSNYGELMGSLKKILSKDSNINVVAVAAKVLSCLASGLRKKFTQYAPMFVPVVLEKFKEKKPLVANACSEAIDAIANTTTLEAISEDILAALDSKTPSVKIQTSNFLKRAFCCCTPATFPKKFLKPVCPALVKNLTSSDVEVRDASAAVLGATMKVVGEKNIAPFLVEIKDDHLKMEKIKEFHDKTVLTSLAQPSVAGVSVNSAKPTAAVEGGGPVVEMEVDMWELLQPVDILSKLPKNFYEQLESTKWLERKESLDALLKLMQDNPRFDHPSCNYNELTDTLKKILMKDNNVNVVSVAAKVLACLASGLRKKFTPYAPMFVLIVLEKFKEKKPIVVTACSEAIDNITKTTTLEAIAEDILTALDNKSPSVKIQTATFLSRAFSLCTPTIMLKKLLKIYCPALIKNINVSDPEVRDSAALALGAAMKVVGEKNMVPFINEIKGDHLKMDKIKEYSDKMIVVLTKVSSEPVISVGQVAPKKPADPASQISSVPKPPLAASSVSSVDTTSIQTASQKVAIVEQQELLDVWDSLEPLEVLSKLPENFYEQIESAKWLERKETLEVLLKLLVDAPRLEPSSNYGELMGCLKKILSKDSNINVVAVAAKVLSCLASGLRKKFTQYAPMFVPVVLEKFKEKKPLVANACSEAIDAIAKTTTLEAISEDILAALDSKTPSVKIQTSNFLKRIFCSCTPASLPKKVLKTVCPALVKNLTSSDVEVRDASAAVLGAAMKVVGEKNIAPLLVEIKDDHLKMEKIKEFHDKTVLTLPAQPSTSGVSGNTAAIVAVVEGGAPVVEEELDPWELLQPVDILSKLPKNFYEQLESTKWLERKESLDALLKLMLDNPRFDHPSCNYSELADTLKKILTKDNNVNVVSVAAKVVGCLASGLRKKFTPYVPMFVCIVLEKFKEKKPIVVTACSEAIDSIAKTTTLEAIADDVLSALDNKSPSVKIQTATFLSRAFCSCTPTIMLKKLLKIYCPALIKNINVSDPEVRDSSALALGAAMKVVGEKNILSYLNEIKNDHLKMDKIKEYCDKTVVLHKIVEPQVEVAKKPAESLPQISSSMISSQMISSTMSIGSTMDGSVRGSRSQSGSRKPGETNVRPKKQETFDGGALIDTKQKLQRFQEEKALKILRWSFNAPTDEHVEQLKNQMATVCKPALHVQLFHTDFKQYLKAIDVLMQCLETCPDATVNNLDLLLKWCTLRFFETNPSVLLKCLEYIQASLNLCIERYQFELHDIEINSFVPYLLLKSGEPKEPVRFGVRQILEKLCKLYPTSKLFPLIIEGCKTKNSRQKAECLEQLGSLIELYGLVVCGQPPSASLKAIAVNIGDRDNTVRNAALNAVVAAYLHVGDRVYKLVGPINEKEFRMLEERIKRTAKNRLVMKPQPPAVEVDEKKSSRGKSPASGRQPLQCAENEQAIPAEMKKTKSLQGMFQLEMEKIGGQEISEDSYRMPKLREHAEVDEILKNPLIIPRSIKLRPSSPAKRVSQNLDAVTMLDTAISQVTSSSMSTSIQALVQLDEIVKDSSKAHFLQGKIDQLLMAVYFQLRMAYNSHMNDNGVQQNDVIRLYRHLCVVLLSLCNAGDLVKEASDGSLKDLVCQLLTVLVDERLNHTNEGTELIRSINILIVNLVTNTDHTACLVALMRLLRDTLHSQTSSTKFQDLVMKCIWKLSRQLTTFADKLQIDRILVESHQFFVDFPSSFWKTRPNANTPARTVKTILNSLCQIYGDKILDFVGAIEQPESSEVVQYLKKCLNDICAKQSTTIGVQNGQNAAVPAETVQKEEVPTNKVESVVFDERMSSNSATSQPVARVFNKFHRAELSEIFKKIGSKEKTKEGLTELYEYLQAHPEADIDTFYKKSSAFFQNYIQKNLKRIADERKKMNLPASLDSQATSGVTVCGTESVNFMENLQKLRANCGLEPAALNTTNSKGNDDAIEAMLPAVRSSASVNREPEKQDVSSTLENDITSDEIENLKKRLEKIKRAAL